MRVLHIYSGNLYGGIEALLVTLARNRGMCPEMEPHFAICFDGPLGKQLIAAGAAVHPLGNVRVRWPWTVNNARQRLVKLIERERFDIVVCHSCWPHALFAPVIKSRSLPLVYWAHDALRGRHWLERLASRHRPDVAIANSRFTEATLRRVFAGVRSEVVYLPVAPPELADGIADRLQKRAELQTPNNATVIVQACRLERWKGHGLLLSALARVKQREDWVCWIAGGPQRPHEFMYLQELKDTAAIAQIHDRIRFLGQRNDVAELLAAADIHCQPNTAPEPFGIAFVEALYAGLPVVTTAMGAALEIVADSCGVLVPPDAQALSAGLARLLDDACLRKRLGAGGPARAALLCDPARQMRCLADVLDRTMSVAGSSEGLGSDEPPVIHPVLIRR